MNKITTTQNITLTPLDDVKFGTIFMYEGEYYMRLHLGGAYECVGAINLKDGCCMSNGAKRVLVMPSGFKLTLEVQ